jgi:hypothetical protein
VNTTRRTFLTATPAALALAEAAAPAADRISLAAWSLVRSYHFGRQWTNLDLPRICREQFSISGLEFVNTFFENPLVPYVRQLKRNAAQHGVTLVRIMVDEEGDMAALDPKERMQAAIAHRKWIDIAHDLGCTDIRCNMRGGLTDWKQDGDLVKRALESIRNLVEYSRGSGLNVIVENHGRASSDHGNLAALVKGVEDTRFGLLPDFGNINPGDDNAKVIRSIAPWAKGVSVKAAWDEQGKNPWDIDLMIRSAKTRAITDGGESSPASVRPQ